MKRDMNLIRSLLLETEGATPKQDLSSYTTEQLVYHSALLVEAGLVDGTIIENGSGYPAGTTIIRLTWAGHDFLDAARSDTIWKKAGEKIKAAGVEVTIDVLKEVLKQVARQSLGLP